MVLACDPQILRSILGDGVHHPAWNATYGDISAVLQIAESTKCGNPDAPAVSLENCFRNKLAGPSFVVVGHSLGAVLRLGTELAVSRDLPVDASVQETIGTETAPSILGGQNSPDQAVFQALLHTRR